MGKSRNVIPEEFESIRQIQDFWDNHSTFDYWEEMEDIKMELSPTLRSKLELKKLYNLLGLSSEQIALVENKAKLEDIDSRKLISKWILEHV
ncbi:hypothetical protein M1O57_05185 [Dehalococcoidia bacterium]|nr:hypothetical protein [Dehalococcoidia bacterium]MCL0059860.1 hypothetical protein [Dehalococcoidia bacterium]MCL0075402.1 hypothetical protein [Dehalococcoidia bacterium]MCL0079181.1 hypothetical protein [Dehalococcoidia bacterium]MCL0103957.1 hypothetical protein [Dehalococcoidia bacterium]